MEYNKESVKQLLSQVNTLNEAYKIVRKNTGEDFNIFQILGMETAEVKTHSKFLAELLNPKGSHLQGDVFLKLFIDYLNKISGEEENTFLFGEKKVKLNSENSKIQVEKHIGKITDREGGRIDIIIEDSENRLICIENKIYAGEQDKQLLRYKNFGDKFTECHLLFLTLYGNKCSTLNEEDGIVYSISYKKHIIEWLELCKKETVNLPILRESIGQYINLIKKLTHQTTNKDMEKDIVEIISSNTKNFESSKLIRENYDRALQLLIDQQRNIIIKLFVDSGIDSLNIGIAKAIRYDEFFLTLKDFEIENQIYELGINFELANNWYFFCIIKKGEKRNDKHNNDEIFTDIRNNLQEKFENLTSKPWTVGKSETFTIGIDANKYYYPETNNEEIYKKLVKNILDIKNTVNTLF